MKIIKKFENLIEISPFILKQGLSPLFRRLKFILNNNFPKHQKIACFDSHSQNNQDLWIMDFLNHYRIYDGVVLDIGANDGITFSNSYALEKKGFQVICVEPNPDVYKVLIKNRVCQSYNCGIGMEDGVLPFLQVIGKLKDTMLSGFEKYLSDFHFEKLMQKEKNSSISINRINVEIFSVESFINKYNIGQVDVLLIDTEGGELEVVKKFIENKNHIKLICIENNENHYKVAYEMTRLGYHLEVILGGDEIYSRIQ
jgi:FkbM family methyltransferase